MCGHFSLLPLWEKVARTQSVPDEGSLSIDRPEPLTRLEFAEFIIGRRFAPTRWLIRATLSHKGRGEERFAATNLHRHYQLTPCD
jgi:hypothetical protein